MKIVFAALAISSVVLGCKEEPREGACVPVEGAVVVENEGWSHKNDPVDHVYVNNPPASGPHYPVWASYGVHEDPLERGFWVHNLEHGAIVLLIGDSATAEAEAELRRAFEQIPVDDECGHNRTIVAFDPLMEAPVAAVAADTLLLPGADGVLDADLVVDFAVACMNHAPENVCQ